MKTQRGVTYLVVLLAIALIGIGLQGASELWSTTIRHQRLAELRWVGQQYVQAIGSYYESSPGTVKTFPRSVEELLQDGRVLFVRRHLRQAYVNPLSGRMDWELVPAPTGGFRGVRVVNAHPETAGRASSMEFVYTSPASLRTAPLHAGVEKK